MSSRIGEFSSYTNWRLKLSIVVVAAAMVFEVYGGILSNSLALLSDAGHMLTDLIALILSWLAYRFVTKESDSSRSYGYHRFQVMAAFVNGLSLFIMAALVTFEALKRCINPLEVHWKMMLSISTLGLIANIVVFVILYRKDEHDINIKSAVLHVIGDLLGSVAAIVSSIVIMFTGWQVVDPILSIFVSTLMFFSAYKIVKSSGNVLLEGKPEWIDLDEVKGTVLASSPGILDIHHIHLWSLTMDYPVMTMHAKFEDGIISDREKYSATLGAVKSVLHEKFGISHVTVEVEHGDCPEARSICGD